jgi:hypothetical protein
MEWIRANTIVGPAASGDNYFQRPKIQRRLWGQIEKGNFILFTAPRRIGKSSIMKYLAKHHGTAYLCDYKNISSDASTQDFYKRLFDLSLGTVNAAKRAEKQVKAFFKTFGIDSIGPDGVKLKNSVVDYKALLLQLLPELKKAKLNVVLFVDEFPDVIKNIHKKEGTIAALDILHTLRSLRHDEQFTKHLTLVLSGSVGLDHVVKQIDRTAVINDLNFQYLDVLKGEEPMEFISHLVNGATMQVENEVAQHLLKRLEHAMPYYIQLFIETCDELLFEEQRPNLSKSDIDWAWEEILKESKYFSDWDERLKEYFPDDYPFFQEVLKEYAHQGKISIQAVFDIGTRHEIGLSFKAKMDDVLLKDGYLFEEGNNYSFLSPLLRDWWKRRYPQIKNSL